MNRALIIIVVALAMFPLPAAAARDEAFFAKYDAPCSLNGGKGGVDYYACLSMAERLERAFANSVAANPTRDPVPNWLPVVWGAVEPRVTVECQRAGRVDSDAYLLCMLEKVDTVVKTAQRDTAAPPPSSPLEADLRAKYGERCAIVGRPGTPDYGRCLLDSADRDAARRQQVTAAQRAAYLDLLSQQDRQRRADQSALLNAGRPPGINCTTSRLGQYSFTNCQ